MSSAQTASNDPEYAFVWKSLQRDVNSPHEFIRQHQHMADF